MWIPHGLMGWISASHHRGRSSIPGVGTPIFGKKIFFFHFFRHFFQSAGGKLTEILEQKCKSKY